MYFDETQSFINLRDIINMYITVNDAVLITYRGGHTLTVNCISYDVAKQFLDRLSKEAYKVQKKD